MEMNAIDLAGYIDYTLLKPEATEGQIKELCKEAKNYKFASVCINPIYVSLAKTILKTTDVNVCTVVGFPLGANQTSVKVYETKQAISDGAREIDMVMSISIFKSGNYSWVENDIRHVVQESEDAIVKVIIEAGLLSEQEIIKACNIVKTAGGDFVKTSTGFIAGGATVKDVKLMKDTVGDSLNVKAAGGIKSYADAMKMINAGASRIGASSGIQIIKGAPNFERYDQQ